MENNHIIILLLIIIIALLAIILGAILLQDMGKEECSLKISCNETMRNGEKITVKLTDLNKTPIKNQNLKIKLKSGNDTLEYNLTTNSKGKATLKLTDLDDGKYTVNCSFDGNNHYKPTSAKKKFTYDSEIAATAGASTESSSTNSIDANRPVNDANYKGYNPYHESEVTSDGWNPREHEVSRESMGDGNQKIKYDDGYFRIVDNNGYVITYGYGG